MSAGDWKSLYQAAEDGDLALVQYHLAEGVNPNHQHPEILRTPLVASLVEGHLDVANFLLMNGADANLLSEMDNLTPLQAARLHGHRGLEATLRQRGAIEPPAKPFWSRWLPV